MQKRAPALLDNLAQAFLMAPFFVLLEVIPLDAFMKLPLCILSFDIEIYIPVFLNFIRPFRSSSVTNHTLASTVA